MIKHFRFILVTFLILAYLPYLFSQSDSPNDKFSGEPIVLVFADVYSGLNQGNNPTGIQIQRAYLGYDLQLQKGFSTKVVLDIGNPDNLLDNSDLKRYAYFKYAYLQYKTEKFNFKFGIIPMQVFKVQTKNWGHRYVEKSASDKYGLGSSADLGISANYKITSFAELDFTISNGEGNATEQQDNTYIAALGLTLKPYKGLILRTYADLTQKAENQITLVNFIGYQIDKKIAFGIEYDRQLNANNVAQQDLNLYSFTGSYFINSKFQLFAYYTILRSDILSQETQFWNMADEGNDFIGGIQYSPISQIRMAINYREWIPFDESRSKESFIYFNIEFGL